MFAGGVLVGGAFAGGIVAGGPLLPGLLLPGPPLCRCGKANAVASRAKITAVSFMMVELSKKWLFRAKSPTCGVVNKKWEN